METVTILVTDVFSTAVAHALVHVPPLGGKAASITYSSVLTTVPGLIVALMSGRMVCCCTFSNRTIRTAPPRSIIPKIGGFPCRSRPDRVHPRAADGAGHVP